MPNDPIDLSAYVKYLVLKEPAEPGEMTPFAGILAGSFSFTGFWDGEWPRSVERRRIVLSDEFVLLGLPLWTWRREFDADVSMPLSLSGEIYMSPVTSVTERRAEPWRRALFHALRPVYRLVDSVRHGWGDL